MDQAYEERSSKLAVARVDPRLDPLRDDPRFRDLLRRRNFPESGHGADYPGRFRRRGRPSNSGWTVSLLRMDSGQKEVRRGGVSCNGLQRVRLHLERSPIAGVDRLVNRGGMDGVANEVQHVRPVLQLSNQALPARPAPPHHEKIHLEARWRVLSRPLRGQVGIPAQA